MKVEIETRILNINKDKIIKKLEEIWAEFIMDRFMKRKVYEIEEWVETKWIRLRDDWEKITLTRKEVKAETASGTLEAEVQIKNFEDWDLFLNALWYYSKAYQENKRTSYILDWVNIEIDTWPRVPTYLEIEWESEEAVYKIVEKLGYKKEDCSNMSVVNILKSAWIDPFNLSEYKF